MQKPGFVTEITGIRAIAALVILGAHYSWVSGLSSGLALFLIISGYVSGAKIKRALASDKRLGIFPDLKNTLWKLSLPMHIVLLVIALWIYFSVDVLKKADWLNSVFAMSLGYGNYYEIQNSADYWVRSSIQSPTLHLWAMSMLIQGAIALAIIRFLVTRIAPNISVKIRQVILAIVGTIALFFGFVDAINFDGTTTYHFNSLNWAWAFVFGLVLGGMTWRLGPTKLNLQVATILFTLVLILGILPVIGLEPLGNFVRPAMGFLAAIILLVPSVSNSPFQNFLNSKSVQFLGGISFGIYLIHWPLLMIFKYYTFDALNNENHVEWYFLIGLAILSILLAWGLQKFAQLIYSKTDNLVESRKTPIQLFALIVVPVFVLSVSGVQSKPNDESLKVLVPPLAEVIFDRPTYQGANCTSEFIRVCSVGDENSETRLVIIGTSTAGQWLDAIAPLAQENSWFVQVIAREGCTHADRRQEDFCNDWREEVASLMVTQRPELIIMETSHANVDETREEISDRDQLLLEPFAQAGLNVMGIRTTPRFSFMIPECISANSDFETICGMPADSFYLPDAEYQNQIDLNAFTTLVDLTDVICPQGFCSPVDDNVIKYPDSKHLTATYLRTLSDELEPYLLQALSKN